MIILDIYIYIFELHITKHIECPSIFDINQLNAVNLYQLLF